MGSVGQTISLARFLSLVDIMARTIAILLTLACVALARPDAPEWCNKLSPAAQKKAPPCAVALVEDQAAVHNRDKPLTANDLWVEVVAREEKASPPPPSPVACKSCLGGQCHGPAVTCTT